MNWIEKKKATNTGLFAMSDLMAKVLNEPTKQEEITEMNLEELPKLTEKEERTILLSRALWQTFGEQRSGEIQDDYKFVEIHEHKVCIQAREMQLNDIEKLKSAKAFSPFTAKMLSWQCKLLFLLQKSRHQAMRMYEKPPLGFDFKATIKTNSMITMLTNPVLKPLKYRAR